MHQTRPTESEQRLFECDQSIWTSRTQLCLGEHQSFLLQRNKVQAGLDHLSDLNFI